MGPLLASRAFRWRSVRLLAPWWLAGSLTSCITMTSPSGCASAVLSSPRYLLPPFPNQERNVLERENTVASFPPRRAGGQRGTPHGPPGAPGALRRGSHTDQRRS